MDNLVALGVLGLYGWEFVRLCPSSDVRLEQAEPVLLDPSTPHASLLVGTCSYPVRCVYSDTVSTQWEPLPDACVLWTPYEASVVYWGPQGGLKTWTLGPHDVLFIPKGGWFAHASPFLIRCDTKP